MPTNTLLNTPLLNKDEIIIDIATIFKNAYEFSEMQRKSFILFFSDELKYFGSYIINKDLTIKSNLNLSEHRKNWLKAKFILYVRFSTENKIEFFITDEDLIYKNELTKFYGNDLFANVIISETQILKF